MIIVKEPFFTLPLDTTPGTIRIRNDEYGDGHFGAKRKNRKHTGIDLEADMNTPVCASKSGWAKCRRSYRGYGNLVCIYHLGGYETRYAHLDRFDIKDEQWVNQGDIIGDVGKTGNANYKNMKAHLHFEIRKKGVPLDPMGVIKEGISRKNEE